jgi:hypothetical protein
MFFAASGVILNRYNGRGLRFVINGPGESCNSPGSLSILYYKECGGYFLPLVTPSQLSVRKGLAGKPWLLYRQTSGLSAQA